MYKLTITNEYSENLQAYDAAHSVIKKGETKALGDSFGSTKIDVWGLGSVNILDIAREKISGFSKKTWGCLISYQGSELEYRYEGEGQLGITINSLGQCSVKSNGDLVEVKISSFIIG